MAHLDWLHLVENARDRIENAISLSMDDRRVEAHTDMEGALADLQTVTDYFDNGGSA